MISHHKVAPGDKRLEKRHSASTASVHGGKGTGKRATIDPNLDDDDYDEDHVEQQRHNSVHQLHGGGGGGAGASLRAILPHIINEQNRKTYGTWQRQFDFTRTIIGYLLGIHNFFRFPYLCYKFGGVFFIPYVIMMVIVGIPVVFMEFTIGQYYGVGSYVAFTHMSPILSGVSKLLTWSCVINCWMYTVILAWLRIYSNDATSCLKGWEICEDRHYYNTPHCFTGTMDDECNDLSVAVQRGRDINLIMQNDMLFYNYQCRTVSYYCKAHGWTLSPGKRACVDSKGKTHSIFERRYHATEEYFYGAVLGLQRRSELIRDKVLIKVTLAHTNHTDVTQIVEEEIFSGKDVSAERLTREKKLAKANQLETVRKYLTILKHNNDPAKRSVYNNIKDEQASEKYQDKYWTAEAQRLIQDTASSSFKELQQLSMTTWIMIAVFLFEDLLKISFLSYILNAVPFIILIYVSIISVNFSYSGYGIEQIFAVREGFFADLSHWDIWCEAVIQVIYTTGIGNGVLISLATFNNLNHDYTVDLYATLILAIITSFCGVLITFCSLGQYLRQYKIDVPFREYIKAKSSSSVEFCLIVYSIFLTLISNQNVTIMLFFFMLTSFATDTAIRLVQSVLDTVMDISARFKHHSAMVLVAVCLMGYLTMVPMFKNGAFALFIEFEYFTLRYIMPSIVLIEVGSCVFVYKASRIIDHSEQMGVFSSYSFRIHMLICMYLSVGSIFVTIILNVISHQTVRFNGVDSESFTETFGWVSVASPLIMLILSVVKQLIMVPSSRWGWLLMPLKGKDRKVRRAFLRRIQGGVENPPGEQTTDQEDIRDAAVRWRKMESKMILAMMAKRKEEKEKKDRGEAVGDGIGAANDDAGGWLPKSTPLLVSLVKIAAAAKREDDKLFGGDTPVDSEGEEERAPQKVMGSKPDPTSGKKKKLVDDDADDDEEEEQQGGRGRKPRRNRRLAFIHVKKASFCQRLVSAFMGKATSSGKFYRPKRHAGGGATKRIVTRQSMDGSRIMNLEEDDEQQSEESLSHDDEDMDEKLREKYLDVMDYLERWPGRFDESEIESEGSSTDDSEEEAQDVF